jgi:hypothetical protein
MFERIRTKLRLGSLNRRDHDDARGNHVENPDAIAATGSHMPAGDGGISHEPIGGGMPPNYVKSYDEGRPRK